MTGTIEAAISADAVLPTRVDESCPAPSAEVGAVADNVIALMRAVHQARTRMLAAAEHDVEWSASVLLKCLSNAGPMRSSALAECLRQDPSTVSRQVAALVKDGLLERRADPQDGRASILALTALAGAVLAEHDEVRQQHFATMLAHWTPGDLAAFASLLARFTTDFEMTNDDALRDRMARRTSTRSPLEGTPDE